MSVGGPGVVGATLMVYDLLFGTFVCRPGVPPDELGVSRHTGLPAYERFGQVLALPFQHNSGGSAERS